MLLSFNFLSVTYLYHSIFPSFSLFPFFSPLTYLYLVALCSYGQVKRAVVSSQTNRLEWCKEYICQIGTMQKKMCQIGIRQKINIRNWNYAEIFLSKRNGVKRNTLQSFCAVICHLYNKCTEQFQAQHVKEITNLKVFCRLNLIFCGVV